MKQIRWKRIASKIFALAFVALTAAFCCGHRRLRSRNENLKWQCDNAYSELVLLRTRRAMRDEKDLPRLREQLEGYAKKFKAAIGPRQRNELEELAQKPLGPTEFYFNVLESEKDLRALADRHRVALPGKGCFGFSDMVQQGKISNEGISLWQRQLNKINVLVRILYESSSGDLRFLSIARESEDANELSQNPNDLFDGRNVASLRPIFGGETHIFQMKFCCHTATFRKFMNALEEHLLSVVPRSISVKTDHLHSRASELDSLLVVDPRPVEFTVVLEWAELLPTAPIDRR
ncbi:MAG: Amuc_1100 family pilus-like protein [Puniceicoccales bacterium]|jgi:hypothetical protein|nr:Amuc_1100 family pilus-like protein [Puniceicoccales bacterium]